MLLSRWMMKNRLVLSFIHCLFLEAIKQGLLSDYQVVISVMDNKMYQEYAERGRFVAFDNHEIDARTLASQLLVAKTITLYDLKKGDNVSQS